ncbi:MAG: Ig-like domain-containing protein [Gemmatimonadota bacterium]
MRVALRPGPLDLLTPLLWAVTLLGPASLAGQATVTLRAQPQRLTLEVGASEALTVQAVGEGGAVLDIPVRVAGPRGVLSYRDGRVQVFEAGEYALVATAAQPLSDEPATLRIPVTVTWPPVARVEILPEDPELRLFRGTERLFQARAFHQDGSVRPNPQVRWSTLDPSIASVDRFGNVTGVSSGATRLRAQVGSAAQEWALEVAPLDAVELLTVVDARDPTRTGDVIRFRTSALDADGENVDGLPVEYGFELLRAPFDHAGSAAPAQMRGDRFVADVPGVYQVTARVGRLSARHTFEVEPRDVVQELEVVGHGLTSRYRTTDLWVFEGNDGRDYALTGSKVAGGYAFVFDVTDPANIIKTDSILVDARTVNDVKASPDGRYAALSREGASDRRNGVVILDLEDPAHPRVASTFENGLTGGVHNVFATDTHLFALSNGDKYLILDVTDLENPRYVSEYDHPDSRVHDVWVHDGIAYSAEWGTGVVVVDVGNGRWGGAIDDPVFVTTIPLPTGATHAVFPYFSESAGRNYLFVGDEIMNRRGLAWAGYPRSMGSYAERYDPETGLGGIPVTTTGYIQVVDFTDPEDPGMVARYEVSEFGTHNFWVEDDVLYGVRAVDVSGELLGNLYTQGREMAVFKPAHPEGYTANATMVWGAQPYKGHIFFSDTNSGLWSVRLVPRSRPVS